jgi:cob(I)alamin adenosyltransferase
MGDSNKKPGGSIATRTGDAGETSLLYGQRVLKCHPQVEACGAVDELSAALAMVKATCSSRENLNRVEAIQTDLIALMGEISTSAAEQERYLGSKFSKIEEANLAVIDQAVEGLEQAAAPFTGWALPGSNLHEAALEVARATARRAERRLVGLRESGFSIRPILLQYINRVSDLLWLLARAAETKNQPSPE